ncbi:GTPBP1 family GTP-binding protein [Methanobacterium aggregans]|uniref:GTPBP1 family GTP-binding protein n=1 Tax=Methanobacterium aggregans TaxID=1615586 RepID=UPI001AEAE907|nr:GTP-binding protein [Methanobacterium aggregans]MBP2046301.1 elongation factor 1-alpha [Methanobacterium aggregans]
MTDNIYDITKKGERQNIEFKENLNRDYHLKKERKQQLASQMKYRMELGDGEAVYFIGVHDDGHLIGLSREDFEETLFVLKSLAEEVDAEVLDMEKHPAEHGDVAKVLISRSHDPKNEHMLVGVAGHVDHGKSTLVGTLTTGTLDTGSGGTRIFLDVQKHEIERGLSADLSFAVYGFCNEKPVRLKNPLNNREKSKIVEKCEKVVSFVDTVGHEPWLRTTIRGIVGQKLNYGLLVVDASQGPTHITKEHLGIILAMEVPVIVAVTKIDTATDERVLEVKNEVFKLLKLVGRIPYMVKSFEDADFVAENMNQHIVPVLKVSAVTGDGLKLLDELFLRLKISSKDEDLKKPFMMYIDRIYSVTGVGTVVSGTVRQGKVKKGDKILLGPSGTGEFMEISAKSIEMHHYKKETGESGEVVGISITGADMDDIRRGMVVCHENYPAMAVREFEAEVAIFVHPTTIKNGYECITHIETIAETVIFKPLDKEYLSAGDNGRIRMRFKYRPCCIHEGQKLIFREGRSKGFGTVTKIPLNRIS